ncbi:MAG: hypothetical protein Q4F31_02330 [Eubacteriales bacterium]|nr:hypothetical protein [Eubacteriales bacterium]
MAGCLCGCGVKKPAAAVASVSSGHDGLAVSSVEIYNRTGKIQKEDFYSSGNELAESVDYTVEYTYNDSGLLTAVNKKGGGIGNNAPVETYLYSGNNCTQRVVYDKNGSTEKIWYWTYDKNGALVKERIVSVIVSAGGKAGRAEEITEYSEDGTASVYRYSADNDYSRDEYGYDSLGRLITDNYYHSSDGKTFRFFETRLYAYDESGNLVKSQKRDSGGTIYFVEIYEYDPNGNILKDTAYSSTDMNEDERLFQHIYEYGENGKLSFEASYVDADMTQTYYEYDSKGNCTGISVQKYRDGKATDSSVTETEYDAHSNPVKETVKSGDSAAKVRFVCEYEYYDDGEIKKKTNFLPDSAMKNR